MSSVGGTFGPELDGDTLAAGSIFLEWRGAATNPPPAGAHELQGFAVDHLTEVGEVLSGVRPLKPVVESVRVQLIQLGPLK